MRFLTPAIHRVLDFVTVLAFALAPTLVPLTGLPAILAYTLAVVHLALTLATEFTESGRKPLSLRGHGALEAVVGIALLVLPFVVGWTDRPRIFYLAAGGVILVVSALSRYRTTQASVDAAV